jgi:hypothetical protein
MDLVPLPDVRVTLWGWIVLSLISHVLARFLLWQLEQARQARSATKLNALATSPWIPWAASFVRAGYFVVLPYWLLLRGVTNPRWMGLSNLDWPRSLGIGIPLGLVAAVGLVAVTWHHTRAVGRTPFMPRAQIVTQAGGWAMLIPAVLYREVHWAFYRCGTLAWGLGWYWGVFGSLGLILGEQALDPFTQRDLSRENRAFAASLPMALSILSAVSFFATANLWLGIALHWTVEWSVLRFVAAHSTKASGTETAPAR